MKINTIGFENLNTEEFGDWLDGQEFDGLNGLTKVKLVSLSLMSNQFNRCVRPLLKRFSVMDSNVDEVDYIYYLLQSIINYLGAFYEDTDVGINEYNSKIENAINLGKKELADLEIFEIYKVRDELLKQCVKLSVLVRQWCQSNYHIKNYLKSKNMED